MKQIEPQSELASAQFHRTDMRPVAGTPTRLLLDENDPLLWSLALVGPAAIILILTALGLTITFRSWHEDIRL